MLKQQYQSLYEPMDEAVNEPVSQQTAKPKVVLFGDSISSVVGYQPDSQADTRFGNTVADVVSSYLGVPVDSQAMGGVTTKDALTGSTIPYAGKELSIPYGTYETYLKNERPNVVILRFGAADAIRLNDPQQTISNLQKMLDLAKQYGATPVLIGVSPFAAGGDSRAGNINVGYIDPYIQSADRINAGIQQLAQQNQLPFVDIKKLQVPQGALLDGVHPTAEFGKQMADYIGQAVTAALPEFGGSAEKYQQFVQAAPASSPLQQAAAPAEVAAPSPLQQTATEAKKNPFADLKFESRYQPTGASPETGQAAEQYAGEFATLDGAEVQKLFDLAGANEQQTGEPVFSGYSKSKAAPEYGEGWFKTDVYDTEGNYLRTNIHNPSEDKYGLRDMATLAAMALTMNPGVGAAIGGSITQGLGISASAATKAFIGNTIINTVLNGGDIESAVKGSVASWAGAQAGQLAGESAKTMFSNPEGIKLISNVANQVTRAAVLGQSIESAAINTLAAGAIDFATAKIPGFDKLPDAVKSTIRQSINAAVQGKDIDPSAMLANAAKEGLLSYGLSQIPQFNEADARTQSFITTMLRSGIDGGDLSDTAIKWAVGQAQQEFQKVIKAGPALDELKKAGIIKDASYFGLDDRQKELVDRLAAQKDPKAAAAQYINEQTTTPEEIRQFYKQITGKDATDAEAELLSTFTGPDEATARLGLENQIRANAAADELRFEELNKVFTNPQATDQDLINVMAEYKITPAFVEKITGKKYDDIVRQMDARFMSQDEVTEAYRTAREAAGLEPRDPTPDEILRYVGSNAGVTAQIQAEMDREATTFDGSGAADIKEAMAAAKAAGYNNFTGPDGKTYMVSSPSVAIQAGAFDGTKLGSVEEARQAALREGKQTFVGPDEQTYRVTEKAAGGADRVFDASGYDPANEQQKALAAYSAYKLGYKNIAFADGTVFELSDKVGQSVANYDRQVAEARRLATQSEQSRQNAFDGSKFSDKGTAAIAANSAGKSSFTFSDGKVYQLPENFAQLVMPDQTAAETKRLNEQNQVLVSDAKGRAKTSFDSAWRAVIPFADPPAEGSTLRNLVSSLIFTGGAGVNMGVIGAINGVASIKLGAEPTVGYAGPDVEDARRYGVVISPYDTPEQRAAKFRQLQELKDAGAQPLTVSNATPIGRGNAWYDFAQQLKEIGAFNSPEAQESQRRISDFLKDVPAWEKPIALMAIANQGNWLGVTSYIAEELPEEMPALIAGNVIGSAYRLGLTGKAAISTLLDTAQDSGRAFQYGYEESRSKGKDESQSKIDGAIAAGVTAATELLPDFLADRTLLKALHNEAAGIATNVLTNYAKNTGIALGTSFVTEYISGGSYAAIMNKINYGDWKWDDAFTQATIEGFVGLGVAGTIMAGHDVSRAIGYMRDGTVATVKDLLDRNPNINYSTISRTEPLFNFSGNAISLDQLSQVTNVALADPTFEVSNFVETLNEMGQNGITPTNAVNLALTYTADPTSAAWKDVTPVGDVVAVNDNGTVTIQNRDGSQTTARADTALKVGDSVQVNPNTGTAVTSPAKVVSTDGNTAIVRNQDGTTATVKTDAKVGDKVNTNQVTNTATVVDTTQAATQDQTAGTAAGTTADTTATTGAVTQTTPGAVVDTAGTTAGTAADTTSAADKTAAPADTAATTNAATTSGATAGTVTGTTAAADASTQQTAIVVVTNTDGTKAVVENPDGTTAVVDTPGGAQPGNSVVVDPTTNTATTVDATANTGTVIATSPDGTSVVVEKPDGTTTVVSTDGAAAVGDTVNVNPVDNTATVTTPPVNVTDGVVADVNVTDGTATVITSDGTKTIVDTAGQDVAPGAVVSVNTSTATVVPAKPAGPTLPPPSTSLLPGEAIRAASAYAAAYGSEATYQAMRDAGYVDTFAKYVMASVDPNFGKVTPTSPVVPNVTSQADLNAYVVNRFKQGELPATILQDLYSFGYTRSGDPAYLAMRAIDNYVKTQPVAPELQPGGTSIADLGYYIVKQLTAGKSIDQIRSDISSFGYEANSPDVARAFDVAKAKKPDSFVTPAEPDRVTSEQVPAQQYSVLSTFPEEGAALVINARDQSRSLVKYQPGMQAGATLELRPQDLGIRDPMTGEIKFGATTGKLATVISRNANGTFNVQDSSGNIYAVTAPDAKVDSIIEVDPVSRTVVTPPAPTPSPAPAQAEAPTPAPASNAVVVVTNDTGTKAIVETATGETAVVDVTGPVTAGDTVSVDTNTNTAVKTEDTTAVTPVTQPDTSQTAVVVAVNDSGTKAVVETKDGAATVVETPTGVTVGDAVVVDQATNTATKADEVVKVSGPITVQDILDMAMKRRPVDLQYDMNKDGRITAADALLFSRSTAETSAPAAVVVATNDSGTKAVVETSTGQTAVVNTNEAVKVGDTVTVDTATNTATKSDVAVEGNQVVNTNTGVAVDTNTGVVTNPNTNTAIDTNTGVAVNANTGVAVDTNTGTAVNTNTNTEVNTNTGVATNTNTNTAVDTNTGTAVNPNTNTAVDTNTGTAVNANTGVAVDTNTGVATNTNTNTAVDTNTGVATNPNTNTAVDTNTGVATNQNTNTAVDTNTGVTTNPNTNTAVDTNTGTAVNANTGVAVDTNTGVATNTNTNTAVDTNTGTAVNPNTNTAVDTNTGTAVNTNTGVVVDTNTGVATNANTNTAVDTNTGVATNANTNTAVDTNTGVATNANTNTAVDTNTGVTVNPNTNTAVDTNTGVATTVNPNTNTQTNVNTNTGTATTVDPNTGVQTQVDPNTNTQTTVDPNTNTQTQTNTATGVQVKTNVDEPPIPPEDPRIKQLQDRIDQLIQAGLDQTAATNAAMSELTGQISTLTQAQTAAEQARQQAAQEAARQQRIRAGLSMLSPDAGGSTSKLPDVSPLQTSGVSNFISPLAAFLSQVERNQYAQPKQAQQPMMPQTPAPSSYAYGKEPSIDALLDPYGEQKQEEEQMTVGFKSGGLASPLFAAGGGTRYGQYAGGGLNVVHHSGKARVDFRRGDAVTGPGDGQSDDIPAMLADGEFVFPADVVAALGNGSTKAGSDKLYDMMHSIRAHARSSGPKDLPPPAKSPLEYLKGSTRKSKQKSARR